MKHKILTTLILALGLTEPSVSLSAQEPVQHQSTGAGARSEPSDSAYRPDARFRAAEAKLSAGVFDPAAAAVLGGAEKYARSIFKMPSLQFQRAVTERVATGEQRGDVLIAEWSFQEVYAKGLVVLTDTPYYSNFDLRMRDCQIGSKADLTAFLRATLLQGRISEPASERAQVRLPPTDIRVTGSAQAITFFSGDTPSTSPYPYIADFNFSGLLEGQEWFLDFAVGKSGTRQFLGVPPWIPERFPPLSELVKSWSFQQIRGSVGDPVRPFVGGADFTSDRDEILIAELARRGLSEAQVIDLLTDVQPTPDGYNERLRSVIAGIRAAGKTPVVSRFFTAGLAAYERIGPIASESVAQLFKSVPVDGCPAGVEAQALDVLTKGIFLEGPLAYLGRCSISRETIAALEATHMPTEKLKKQKEFAMENIRRGLEHPAKRLRATVGR